MRIVHRCSCQDHYILAEQINDLVYVKKRGFELYINQPTYLKCAGCGQWYELKDNKMIKKTDLQVKKEVGYICIYCGYIFNPDTIRQACPKCGKIQSTTNLTIKQNR